jgi:hypothetical protein
MGGWSGDRSAGSCEFVFLLNLEFVLSRSTWWATKLAPFPKARKVLCFLVGPRVPSEE